MSDADRPLSIPRTVAAWQQAIPALGLGARSLGTFVDRVAGGLSSAAAWQRRDDARRLLGFAHTLRDVSGPPEGTFGVALARDEWERLSSACLGAMTALTTETELFGDPITELRWPPIVVLMGTRSAITAAIGTGPSEETPA